MVRLIFDTIEWSSDCYYWPWNKSWKTFYLWL